MKRSLLLFLLLNSSIAFSQTSFKLNIDSLSEVTFPAKPTIKKKDTTTIAYFAKVNSADYLVIVQDLSKKDVKLREDSLSAFYEGVIEGNLTSVKGSQLLSKKEIVINGFKAIDFSYKIDSVTILPDIRFQRTIFLNKKVITYCFWTFSDSLKINTAKKDAFFKSVTITADKDKTKQYTDEGLAYDLGVIVGKYLAIPLVIVIGLLIVFLIRRVAYKKIK